ncbi:hypothetical protein EDC01DRAFT_753664 [Geopyxis carbonaria]|nr:hypothetical protein EDC01DRAFT_753664 [Geopyxis carbonaria]
MPPKTPRFVTPKPPPQNALSTARPRAAPRFGRSQQQPQRSPAVPAFARTPTAAVDTTLSTSTQLSLSPSPPVSPVKAEPSPPPPRPVPLFARTPAGKVKVEIEVEASSPIEPSSPPYHQPARAVPSFSRTPAPVKLKVEVEETSPRAVPSFARTPAAAPRLPRPVFLPSTTPRPPPRTPVVVQESPPQEQIDDEDSQDSPVRKRRRLTPRFSASPSASPPASSQPDSLPSPTLTRALPFATPRPQSTPQPQPQKSLATRFREAAVQGERTLPVDWTPTKSKKARAQYVPGGLAATVAGWVLGTRTAQGRRDAAVLRVSEWRGVEGGVCVRDVQGVGWVLAGGRGGEGVRDGVAVRVEWPWWEVEMEGEGWRWGVFWRVLEEGV